jgi:hypothetical protein
VGFGGFVGLGCFRVLFGSISGAFSIFWVLGFLWVLLGSVLRLLFLVYSVSTRGALRCYL